MRKKFLSLALALMFAVVCEGIAFADNKADLQRMSEFLNSFTELNLFNFDTNAEETDGEEEGILHLGNPFNVSELIRFGIRHNYINSPDETVRSAPTRNDYGSLIIDGKFVAETVEKYFGIKIRNRSVIDGEPSFHYDGKYYYFEAYETFDDGEPTYFTDVQQINEKDGRVELTGEIYNSRETADRPGVFTAYARRVGEGVVITSMTTDWIGDWKVSE
ncbi:MAG: hypothetical protein IJU31_04655 [Synergistaceae bacterium]|nr:hypothetical protein [Synergistaceae bacterium]